MARQPSASGECISGAIVIHCCFKIFVVSHTSLYLGLDTLLSINGMIVVIGFYLAKHTMFHPVWQSTLPIDRKCLEQETNQKLFRTPFAKMSPAAFLRLAKVICFEISSFLFDDVGKEELGGKAESPMSNLSDVVSDNVSDHNTQRSISTFSCNDLPGTPSSPPASPVSEKWFFFFVSFF